MRYTLKFKEETVKRALANNNISEIARETGLSTGSIYTWIKQFNKGSLDLSKELGPKALSIEKKYQLLLESLSIPDNEIGVWLRKKGIQSDHLKLWKDDIFDIMTKKKQDKNELKDAKKAIKDLQKELHRKDKALAEITALLTLKKKMDIFMEEGEK